MQQTAGMRRKADEAEAAEDTEAGIEDQVGGDWGDAALEETRKMSTRRMEARNRRLMAQLAELKRGNQELTQR